MAKPRPLRVPSDDCVVTVNGETCYPHEGEWMEIVGSLPPYAYIEINALATIGPQLAAIEDPVERDREGVRLAGGAYDRLSRTMASQIVRWTWTDWAGRRLPDPCDDPAVLNRLHQDEWKYLIAVCGGKAPSAEKNGRAPSRIMSSATEIPIDPQSGATDPSPTNVSSLTSAPFTRPSPPPYSRTTTLRTG